MAPLSFLVLFLAALRGLFHRPNLFNHCHQSAKSALCSACSHRQFRKVLAAGDKHFLAAGCAALTLAFAQMKPRKEKGTHLFADLPYKQTVCRSNFLRGLGLQARSGKRAILHDCSSPSNGFGMPRTARVLLPNTAHHVIQRGHNRASVFASTEDYQCYLETLSEWKANLGIKVYAYCLMTNHVHLVVEPGDDVTALSQLMRRLAGRQTRYVNKLEGRTGTLWNGRYKASPIQSSRYLLACTRYVELNPLRARMVNRAVNYPWSSYRQKVGDRPWGWLDEDYCYAALGANITERRKRYAEYTMQVVSEDEQVLLADAVRRNQLTGDHRFIDEVEHRIGIRVERRGQGRPVKNGLSDTRPRGRNDPT